MSFSYGGLMGNLKFDQLLGPLGTYLGPNGKLWEIQGLLVLSPRLENLPPSGDRGVFLGFW